VRYFLQNQRSATGSEIGAVTQGDHHRTAWKTAALRKCSSPKENGDSQDWTTAINECATLRRQQARACAIDPCSQTQCRAAAEKPLVLTRKGRDRLFGNLPAWECGGGTSFFVHDSKKALDT